MTPIVEVQPLSQTNRRIVFGLAVLLFVIAVPISVFYAIGYRFDFNDKIDSIKSVGGLYVRNDVQNTDIFVDDEPVADMRVFQKASYIQNLEAGIHRVHVQGNLVQTWVKELPVYAHFVTEVATFNIPRVPQIRVLTPWNDAVSGESILFESATTTAEAFKFASTTNVLRFASTTATSTFVVNTEYDYVKSLFASSTELKQVLKLRTKTATPKKPTFDVEISAAKSIVATTTKTWRDFSLFEKKGEVYMEWKGDMQNVPYYYCAQYDGKKTTSAEYGEHVYQALVDSMSSTTDMETLEGQRLCRSQIRIDRLYQKVLWFDFYPDSTDLVLMQLQDGLYVVEVDDRAWQNTQLLYPGTNLDVIQDGGSIYIHDGDYYLEVFTEISSQQ